MATAPDLEACLRRVEETGVRRLALDLTGLSFCDCSGLHVFRQWRRGRSLALTHVPATVRRLLELTGDSALAQNPDGADRCDGRMRRWKGIAGAQSSEAPPAGCWQRGGNSSATRRR